MTSNRSSRFIPLIIACSLVAGILVGSFYANHFSGNRLSIINTSSNKLNDMLQIIESQYVDKVNMSSLVENALPEILNKLDPHSAYVSAKDVETSMQSLKGSFSGIGISFIIVDDTVRVVSVIKGGPSENSGLHAGDRIVSINNKTFVGKKVTEDVAMKTLKGPKDSKIKLGILRSGEKALRYFDIRRGSVPVRSIEAAYMLDSETGYVQISNFADATYQELLVALAELNGQGMKKLIIDLRGNGGGYMSPAVQMACEFLPKDQLVLYTQGNRFPREEFKSDGRGTHQNTPLVVLVDESTASASEIFSAAIQDNDRGTVIGRRTFGKGLVQEPIEFRDGSMLRLTIARYYTPAGRCLQKPYVQGEKNEYEQDLLKRFEHGEMASKDSIHFSGKKYFTRLGRTVYGASGVMPDIFVPEEEKGMTSYMKEAAVSGMLYRYAYVFADANRGKLSLIRDYDEMKAQLKRMNIVDKFVSYAEKHGLQRRNLLIKKSHDLMERYLIGYVLDDLMGRKIFTRYLNETDPCVAEALKVMQENKAFPQAEKKAGKKAAVKQVKKMQHNAVK